MHARMIAFYIMGLSTKTLRNVIFVDSIDSVVEKMVVMMRIETETEEKADLKRFFGTFLSFLVSGVGLQTMSQNSCDDTKRSKSRMLE
jgi:hypothetical protein